jgi:putative transposase
MSSVSAPGEEQIIGVLKEHEAGVKTADLYRKHGISEATFYNWKSRFGGLDVSEARRLRTLESENARLKKLLAEAHLDNAALRALHKRQAMREHVHQRHCRLGNVLSIGSLRPDEVCALRKSTLRACVAPNPLGKIVYRLSKWRIQHAATQAAQYAPKLPRRLWYSGRSDSWSNPRTPQTFHFVF